MSLAVANQMVGAMKYEDTPLKKTKKKDSMIFADMSTWKVLRKTAYRHRIGLWATGAILGWAFQLNLPHYVQFWYGVLFG